MSIATTVGKRILDICDAWMNDYEAWDEDCAMVSRFYSGSVIEDDEQQNILGLIDHANYQTGRETIEKAINEAEQTFYAQRVLMNFKLRNYDNPDKSRQENLMSEHVDKLVRKIDPIILDELSKMTDRHVVHGDSIMFFPAEGEGYRPRSGKILTDTDAPINIYDDNFYQWAIYADLQISDVLDGAEEEDDYWTSHAVDYVRSVWDHRYGRVDPMQSGYTSTFDEALDIYYNSSPEELEAAAQAGNQEAAYMCDFKTNRLKVFYFYTKNFNEKGNPIDLHIVARFEHKDGLTDQEMIKGIRRPNVDLSDPLLYHRPSAYSNIRTAAQDFVLDANIGVESPSWGTIKGLGHLNFVPDSMVNLLVSSLNNSAIDKNTPLWEILDSADELQLEKWIKNGYQANGIIPQGLTLVDKQKQGSTIGEALNLITMLQSQANRNAVSRTGSSLAPRDELRINAANRHGGDQRTANNRGVKFTAKLERLLKELGRRILVGLLEDDYPGEEGALISQLRQRLYEDGVLIEYFQPQNVDISYVRMFGDGDPAERERIATSFLNNIQVMPSTEHNNIVKEWIAATARSYDYADQVFADSDVADVDQASEALTKASSMMVNGIPMPLLPSDVPEIQAPVLLSVLNNVNQQAILAGGFTPQDYQGFVTIGQAVVEMSNVIKAKGNKELANGILQNLQKVSTEAQEPLNNMLAKQQAAEQNTPEQQKLALEAQKLNLEGIKTQAKIEKDNRQADAKDRQQQFNEYAQTKRLINDDQRVLNDTERKELEQLRERVKVFEATQPTETE